MEIDIDSESRLLPTPPAFDAPLGEFPSDYRHDVGYGETKMLWLPDGEIFLKICLLISAEFTNVTDRQTYTHTDTA